jgi:hypothetical protein
MSGQLEEPRKHKMNERVFALVLPIIATIGFLSTSYTMAEKSDVSPESGVPKSGTAGHDAHEAVHTEVSTSKGELATLDAGYTESDIIADLPPAEGLRALRKIDYRLVPLLAVLYLVAFIDRSNM